MSAKLFALEKASLSSTASNSIHYSLLGLPEDDVDNQMPAD
jgi:hypothetical protein